jgi:hypothetical protein
MLFLVISTPRPDRPSTLVALRKRYWKWMQPLLDGGLARAVYARVGRGAVALFDVDSNDTLHRLINEWSDIMPAHFDIYPLLDPAAAQRFLARKQGRKP